MENNILPIYLYGAEVLRERAAEVDPVTEKEEIQKLLENMRETLKVADG